MPWWATSSASSSPSGLRTRTRHPRPFGLTHIAIGNGERTNTRYDSYDRIGPKVFRGEFALQDNRFFSSLAEAHHTIGLERNADVARLVAYAPLLANIDHVRCGSRPVFLRTFPPNSVTFLRIRTR